MKSVIRYLFAFVFGIAGIAHFTKKEGFANIVPHYLPFKNFIVCSSGVAEITLSILLLIKRPGKLLKNVINAFLLLVLPANIYMARKEVPLGNIQLPKPMLWARIPLQFVMIKLINKM